MRDSLSLIPLALAATDWRVFAVSSALKVLFLALGFVFHPDAFTLARGYAGIAAWGLPAWTWGLVGCACALWVLLRLSSRDAVHGLWGLMVFTAALAFGYLTTVGVTGGTSILMLYVAEAAYAYYRSGGTRGLT